MRDLDPRGLGQRVVGALALVVAASYALHLAYQWLAPLVPVALSGVVVVVLCRFFFWRR